MTSEYSIQTDERFWAKVDKDPEPGCWNWIAGLDMGYGHFRIRRTHVKAHRYAYERLVGPIPDGLTLDHLCYNPRCVNPAHLDPVTQSVNTKRAAQHRRDLAGVPDGYCMNGHERTPENTSPTSGHCKACWRERKRRERQKQRVSP